jgi:hypothetical protein
MNNRQRDSDGFLFTIILAVHSINGTLILLGEAVAIGAFSVLRSLGLSFFLTCVLLILSPFWIAWPLGVFGALVFLCLFSLKSHIEIDDSDIFWIFVGAFLPVYYVVLFCYSHHLSG